MVFDSDQSLTVLPPELQFAPQHVIWQSWIGLATVVACQTFLVVATLKLAAAAVPKTVENISVRLLSGEKKNTCIQRLKKSLQL